MNKQQAKEKIKELVERYKKLSEVEKKGYNEQQTKDHFIRPLFEALGWNFEEDVWPETDVSGKRVDYAFKADGITKFFIEAKKVSVNLDEEKWAKQAIDYSWHKSVPWVILTDFEAIKIFNTEWDSPDIQSCQFIEIPWTEYLTSEKLWWLSPDAFRKGVLDKEADKVGRRPKKIIDEQLAKDLIRWRDLLRKDLEGYNLKIDKQKIAEYVQKILDRLIFIRTLEDRKIEDVILQPLAREWEEKEGIKANKLLSALNKTFRRIDKTYNSGLFAEGACDYLGDKIDGDDNTFVEIINELYKTKDKGIRYNFADIPADIFGGIYEQYLGYIQKEDLKQKKTSKRKSQGIYYTPRYIVDYIVQNTLGEILKNKTPNEIRNLKILDPACGSGSFLISVYQELINYWQKQEKKQVRQKDDKLRKIEQVYKKQKGNLISSQEKMRILLNNIYGVDLDKEAVELAKLNLLMKMVGSKIKLPKLGSNIQEGNSLISGSEKELKKYFGRGWKNKKAFEWEGKFDMVIGNPPYVRVDGLDKNDKNYWKEIFVSSKGKYDLYYLFIEKSIKLLKEGGKLGFIIPNKFCVASSAKKIREIIINSSKLCEFVSVSQLDVFSSASNYPVILFLTKGNESKRLEIKSFNTKENFVSGICDCCPLNKKDLEILPSGIIPINVNKNQLDLILKLLKNNNKLSDYLKISEGFRIPANFESASQDKFGIVKQYQFGKYTPIKKGVFISEKNISRVVSENSERYKNSLKEKILIAEDALNITSTIDKKFNMPQGGVYFGATISNELTLKYILALLNSKLLSFVYKTLFGGMHMGGGYLRYRTEFLHELPIIEVSQKEQKRFGKLVDEILKLNKELQKLDLMLDEVEYKEIKEKIDKIDKEIDERVFELYGLSKEDQKTIKKQRK